MNMTNLKRLIMLNILLAATLSLSTVHAVLTDAEEYEAKIMQDHEAKVIQDLENGTLVGDELYYALYHAAESGYVVALRMLLAQPGIDVNFQQRGWRNTVLYAAAKSPRRNAAERSRCRSCVMMLLEAGADPVIGRDSASVRARNFVDSCAKQLAEQQRRARIPHTAHEIDQAQGTTGLPRDVADLVADYATE